MNEDLNQIQLKFNKELGLFLNARKTSLKLADDIIFLYEDFSARVEKSEFSGETKTVSIKENFSFSGTHKLSKKYKIISLMQDSLREIEDLIEGAYLQGSFATKDFLEDWSDLDAVIIWSRNLFKKKENLFRARKVIRKTQCNFYQVDPLAHHCFHMCTSVDLNYYSQSVFLPLVVYENSSLLLGKNELTFKVHKDCCEQISAIAKLAGHFESKLEAPSKNLYDFKLDIAHVLLLPSFLLQSKGTYVYKKFSFDMVKKEFPQLNFEIVDWASKIKENWHTPNILKYYPSIFNIGFIYLYVRLTRRKKIKLLTKAEVAEFTKKSHIFLKNVLNLIKNT